MKPTTFYILLSLKTSSGYECFGKFFIGNDRPLALSVFKQFKGSSDVDENSMLTMELMETFNELPLNLKIISCTLKELAENCSIIAKEMFKAIDLEEL